MSYLADPIATPIDIDAGVVYNYVIPQQGFDEMSVDPLTDFEFLLTFDSPAMLAFSFTGTADPAVPTYSTATIRFLEDGLETTQNLAFRILPDSATQRVPNIGVARSLHVGLGQKVNFKLSSDIDDATLSASGLTVGLSVANDRIVGTAPTENGFNVFTLSAINGDYAYYRYFVLLAGTGTETEAQPFFSFPPDVFP